MTVYNFNYEMIIMGTIFGILFLIGVFLLGKEAISEGLESAGDGSGCGCVFGIILILFGLGLISTGLGAPIGMIIIALIAIAMASDKKK